MKNILSAVGLIPIKTGLATAIMPIVPMAIGIGIAFSATGNLSAGANKKTTDPSIKEKARQWMQSQPVKFMENKGQMIDMEGKPAPFVLFKAESPGMNMYITEKGITYLFIKAEEEHEKEVDSKQYTIDKRNNDKNVKMEWNRIDMELKNANIRKENINKEGMSADFSQYFLAHCPQGISNVRSYEKIIIKEIYPGIDWVFYNSTEKGFKYDFIVHANADPNQIRIVYSSLKPLKLTPKGTVEIQTELGVLTEQAPYSYILETKEEVIMKFKITDQQHIDNEYYQTTLSFRLPSVILYLTSTLVIDPQLVWATLYGGTGLDGPQSIDCDLSGNVFIAGYSNVGGAFPLLNPGGVAYFQGTHTSIGSGFIAKFTNTGVQLWSTYYAGKTAAWMSSICIDPFGNIFVTGSAGDSIPLWDPGGGAYFQGTNAWNGIGFGYGDAFILKFSNAGIRLWATYYGGGGNDGGNSICTDVAGNVFVTGFTGSTDFPIVLPSGGSYFQWANAGNTDVFILKFSNAGAPLLATHYGGSGVDRGYAICTDTAGNIFITGVTGSTDFPVLPSGGAYFQWVNAGNDAFILKFDNGGVRKWATYYGGTKGDDGGSISSDLFGNIFVEGHTGSTDLPVLNPGAGAYFQGANTGSGLWGDVFILKFSNSGVLLWATYGVGNMNARYGSYDNIAIDPCGNVYVSFEMDSTNRPLQPSCSPGFYDNTLDTKWHIFLMKFSNAGVRLWATTFGSFGWREPLAVDKSANLFVTGEWFDSSNPFTNPGGGAYYDNTPNGMDDGFIAKFIPPVLTITTTPIPAGCSCTGSVTATASGGCLPYQYIWYNSAWGQIGNTQTISNLCTGNYQVIVKDSINCSFDTAFVTITGTGSLSVTASSAPTTCGSSNGTATVTSSGGTSPYTYIWNPSGQTTSSATGLNAGTYTVTVTDSSGCTVIDTVTVSSSGGPVVSLSDQQNVLCNGTNTGYATVSATGGTMPYTFNWSNGQMTSSATGLNAGTYSVAVTDVNNCTTTQTVIITQPTAITASITSTNTACNISDGTATVTASNGVPGYTYFWSNSQTVSTATGLGAGTYTVTITDANGCIQTATVIVTSTGGPTANASANPSIINQEGSTTLTASGGSSYSWNNGMIVSTIIVTPSVTTVYCVTVTDTNNCTDTACVTVTIGPIDCSNAGEIYLPNAFSPNNDEENDKLQIYYGNIKCIKTFKLVIYNRWGEKVFEASNPEAEWDGIHRGKIMNAAVFVYYLKATLISGEEISGKGNISLVR